MALNAELRVVGDQGGQPPPVSRWSPTAGAVTAVSAVGLIVSGFLVWGQDSGLISAYARSDDRDLAGESFSGLVDAGGSWFGIVTLIVGALAVLVGIRLFLGKRVNWSRLLGPEAGIALGISAVIVPVAYLILQPSDRAADYSAGPGPYIAVLAGLGILVGAVFGSARTRFIPTHEEPRSPIRLAVMVLIGVGVLVMSVFSSWIFDERTPSLADLRGEIDKLVEEGVDPAVAAAQVAELAEASAGAKSTNGLESDGPQLGIVVLVVAGLAAILVGYRALRSGDLSERARWLFDVVLVGLGVAAAGMASSWILSIVRLDETLFVAGVGSFFTVVGGLLIITSPLPYLQSLLLAPPGD